MFERYTEKARRVIFFARYEASQYGSEYIETEHLLLGLLRDDRTLVKRVLPGNATEKLRAIIHSRLPRKPGISTSSDLPLTDSSKRILTVAAKEADALGHESIGTGHLLLALLQEKECLAVQALRQLGSDYEKAKEFVGKFSTLELQNGPSAFRRALAGESRGQATKVCGVRVHNMEHDLEFIRAAVIRCCNMLWHWTKKTWQPQDIAVRRADGRISFDLSLADDTANFQLVQNGWNHDLCSICGWKLYVAPEPECSTGYTNGKTWVCLECYQKFLEGPDYFATAHPEIT
jgi:hypothetical protein